MIQRLGLNDVPKTRVMAPLRWDSVCLWRGFRGAFRDSICVHFVTDVNGLCM